MREERLDFLAALIRREEATLVFNLVVVHVDQSDLQVLHILTSHTVLTVQELDYLTLACAHSTIVVYHDIFESFNESSLNIASLCSLDSSIDQSFATSHSVEEEFLRSEPDEIAVFDETLALRAEVVLGEMWKGTLVEAEGDSLTLDVLLSHTGHDL